ncbi:thiamine phosphate synthase [Paenibacillus sp. Marseille-Q4541]|uniref:thiamine phosphate synthase n=1 Tax=Paenibacillus sp. Marseille-Q4541 TaxID=2831522 RepID=UPI001BA9831A|nr:thiamine phosphate synthase [Paenibacillus sp. Marseille-Q4541]
MPTQSLEFHVISSNLPHRCDSEIESFAAIWPLVSSLHLRKHSYSAEEIDRMIRRLLDLKVPMDKLTLNRQEELAFAYKTGALHVGMREIEHTMKGPPSYKRQVLHTEGNQQFFSRLGVSVHSLEEAKMAKKNGADYVFYGHIYPSTSKSGLSPRGISSLSEVCEGADLPVIAIGGITPERVKEVILAGASGIAVISGVLQSQAPLAAVLRYRNELNHFGEISN